MLLWRVPIVNRMLLAPRRRYETYTLVYGRVYAFRAAAASSAILTGVTTFR